MSLFGLLNKCQTSQGSRLLAQWLRQPLLDFDAICKRQNIVESLVQQSELRKSLQVKLLAFTKHFIMYLGRSFKKYS
jgi:DNA mismatch repair protein MSH2